MQHVAIHPQRVTLRHAHMTEGIKRTGLGIEIGTVAEHEHVTAAKTHVALQHLIVTADGLVGLKDIGILKEDLVGLAAAGLGNLRGDTAHLRPLGSLAGCLWGLRIGGFMLVVGFHCARLDSPHRVLRPHDRRHHQCHHATRYDSVPPAVVDSRMSLIVRSKHVK